LIALLNSQLEGDSFYWPAGDQGVLLIHGFTATTAEVRPLGKFLHASGYTVSGLLLPGHGTSPTEANRYSWLDWADSVDQAHRQLQQNCQRVIIGGESMGALLSLFQASIAPEIERILVYAPALKLRSRLANPVAHLLAPFIAVKRKPASPHTPADELWQGYPVYPIKAMLQLFQLQKAVLARLPDIQQPLLIIQGRLDKTVDPGVPEQICSKVSSPIKEIHWLEKSGHCLILDGERQQAMEITLQFLNRNN
jgi:carboxylesterase